MECKKTNIALLNGEKWGKERTLGSKILVS